MRRTAERTGAGPGSKDRSGLSVERGGTRLGGGASLGGGDERLDPRMDIPLTWATPLMLPIVHVTAHIATHTGIFAVIRSRDAPPTPTHPSGRSRLTIVDPPPDPFGVWILCGNSYVVGR